MRREKNGFRFIILIFAVIAVIISLLIGLLISRGVKSARQNDFAGEMSKLSEDLSETDTASTQIGKTIEEAEEENDEQLGYEIPSLNEQKEDAKNNTSSKDTKKTTSKNNSNKENSLSIETNSENNTKKNTTTETNSKNATIENNSKNVEKEENIKFEAPIKGEILREFAKDSLVFSNTLQEWITHNGVDIKADKTSVVKSAANGTISSIKNDPRYGLTVIINHDNGYQTIYSNLLTAEFVVKDEKVKMGQSIGTVGNSASFEVEDEYHLHFEVLKENEYLDPTQFMNF
ncbi:MAG: M23 family metallopeptidase [Clostridia bacterium]|nr:M23 family metallopeptidase [Clostridia bacterium]